MPDVDAIHDGDRLATLEAVSQQAVELDQQDANWLAPTVTCPCGQETALRHAFRCYYCHVFFCELCAEDHFGPRDPPTDGQFNAMARRLAFKGAWHRKPFGTPASETPWYQKEGWPIFEAIVRHTRLALREAYGSTDRTKTEGG